jgi:hypothetical protein
VSHVRNNVHQQLGAARSAIAARRTAASSVAHIERLLPGWGAQLAEGLAAIPWWFCVQRMAGEEQRNFIQVHTNPFSLKADRLFNQAFLALEVLLFEGYCRLVEHLLKDKKHQQAAHLNGQDISACECRHEA